MKIHFDLLQIKSAERLAAVKALLRLLEEAVREYQERERTALRELAAEQNLDFDEYDTERQILDNRFRYWLPRFAAYSVLALLYSVLEVQLHACARRAQQRLESPFGPEDIKGRGIEAVAAYLTKSDVSDVKHDEAWSTLIDLRDLRNLIAHRAGTSSKKHEKVVNRLLRTYEGDLEAEKTPRGWRNEVWVSLGLCRRFTSEVEAFLGRIVSAVNAIPAATNGESPKR
ncbi:MAG: hypothetical protein OXG72_10190 [Acidobacteria bacterium]|nr:hypothetical protein [Acidobacteriota bacterium]